MNLLILKGRLTADPELKHTPNGVATTTFTLAVDRNYTPKGQEKKADFVRCVAWRQNAEFICNYFSKGKQMLVNAELQSRQYDDTNGNKVTIWEAIVNGVEFCGDRQSTENQVNEVPNIEIDEDEDLPF